MIVEPPLNSPKNFLLILLFEWETFGREARKNKKPESAKERAQREAKIRAQMDKEAEDLVEAVDDNVAASKAGKHADTRKEAEESSSTTAEAAESASEDVELADEAMDDDTDADEEETVLDLDDEEE